MVVVSQGGHSGSVTHYTGTNITFSFLLFAAIARKWKSAQSVSALCAYSIENTMTFKDESDMMKRSIYVKLLQQIINVLYLQ